MEILVQQASLLERPVLRRLLELYQYDLSEIEDTDVDAYGLYGYEFLDHYWTDPGRRPFLIHVDGRIAGFALVNRYTCYARGASAMAIAEFFVMRKYRRRGVGERVARWIFDLFPGKWEVRELAGNLGAQEFWRKVIGRYTGGDFEDVFLDDDSWRGPVQVFETPHGGEG